MTRRLFSGDLQVRTAFIESCLTASSKLVRSNATSDSAVIDAAMVDRSALLMGLVRSMRFARQVKMRARNAV
jgi:hypothetical protein